MKEIFLKGGPIMWPLLICSVIALGVVMERIVFLLTDARRRSPETVREILSAAGRQDLDAARQAGAGSPDKVARVLIAALGRPRAQFARAAVDAGSAELARYDRGLSVLDTIITLAPLLGLLGTVTGMIRTFGLLGQTELGAPQAVTGGIAEALIATAFGLGVAILSLVPFNFLQARMESARREIEAAANQLEMHLS